MPNHPDLTAARRAETLSLDDGGTLRVSVLGMLEIIAKHLRVLILTPLAIATLAVVYVLVVGRTFRAESAFAPEARGGAMQRVAGLAAEFGVTLGGGDGAESVDFYAELVRSRSILEQVVMQHYAVPKHGLLAGGDSASGTLIDVYESGGKTPVQRLNAAIQRLSSSLTVRASPRSNIVHVSVVAPSRELAEAINANVLRAVSDFNVAKRQTRATSERTFVAERLRIAQAELQSAEAALEGFLQGNRRYQDSPQLVVEYGRLQRRVDLRQQVANTLSQAFEQSRIEEVRNTPVITIVERPEGAAKPARTLRQAAMIGGVLGGLATLAFVFAVEMLRAQGELDPAGHGRLREQLRRLVPLSRR